MVDSTEVSTEKPSRLRSIGFDRKGLRHVKPGIRPQGFDQGFDQKLRGLDALVDSTKNGLPLAIFSYRLLYSGAKRRARPTNAQGAMGSLLPLFE